MLPCVVTGHSAGIAQKERWKINSVGGVVLANFFMPGLRPQVDMQSESIGNAYMHHICCSKSTSHFVLKRFLILFF